MEDLQRRVGIEGRDDPVEGAQVAVDEGGDPRRVLDRAAPGPAADIERALRQAEITLQVDQQQVGAAFAGRLDLAAPALGRCAQRIDIGPVRPVPGPGRVEEGRKLRSALMPASIPCGRDRLGSGAG